VPQYINRRNHDLVLSGPNGDKVTIKRGSKVRLPDFYDRYVRAGYLESVDKTVPVKPKAASKRPTAKAKRQTSSGPVKRKIIRDAKKKRRQKGHTIIRKNAQKNKLTQQPTSRNPGRTRRFLGRSRANGVSEELQKSIDGIHYPISNNIGIGILSYNRPASLKRLINSIRGNTNLNRTTIFISDDGSDNKELLPYLDELENSGKFVVLKNEKQLGIAGNSNRLLKCLQRFKNKLLLNDDVQVLSPGWDSFYFKAMKDTGFHHFCQRTPGVYGAKPGVVQKIKGISVSKVTERPHGAVMAMDQEAFDTVGFFDETYGIYGVEHVDWSDRVVQSKVQPSGYYDVVGSNKFFKIHKEESAVQNRVQHLRKARNTQKAQGKRPNRIEATSASDVPSISYIVPFRDQNRTDAILTVINNIRGQLYPNIEIVAVEQDAAEKLSLSKLGPAVKVHIGVKGNKDFNKSKAFNAGVATCSHSKMILHDADTMALADYTSKVSESLDINESAFLGGKVLYTSRQSADKVMANKQVDKNTVCERAVDYFEGGSVGILKSAYWKVGGFNEEFWGYGCEDCDFYARISNATRFLESRDEPFLHLWHPRTKGWKLKHDKNKEIEKHLKSLTIEIRIKKLRDHLGKTKYGQYL
jgi:GT2 family glycosyltransferase